MNGDQDRGRGRGRGRNAGRNQPGNRGRGRNMHRSNSDGGRSGFRAAATSGSPVVGTPPGLGSRRPQNADARYSSSLPTAEGWGLSDAADNTLAAGAGTSSGGNRNSRGSLAGQYAQGSSPGQGRGQTGNNWHRNTDSSNTGRNSGPPGLGRRASGSPHVQSNIVPIPKRYLNNPSGPASTPNNSQQHHGTPNSRGRYGVTSQGQHCTSNTLHLCDNVNTSKGWAVTVCLLCGHTMFIKLCVLEHLCQGATCSWCWLVTPLLAYQSWWNHYAGANKIGSSDRTRHSEYWPQDLLQKGFKNMELFRSVMRINAGDKTQAYASLPGLSADIFIRVRTQDHTHVMSCCAYL